MPDIQIEYKELEIPYEKLPQPYNTDNQIVEILENYKTKISQLK